MKTTIVPIFFGPLGKANTLYCRAVGVADNSGRLTFLYWFALDTVADEVSTSETIVQPTNVSMTPEQWAAWPSGGTPTEDENYQLACVAEVVGAVIPA